MDSRMRQLGRVATTVGIICIIVTLGAEQVIDNPGLISVLKNNTTPDLILFGIQLLIGISGIWLIFFGWILRTS